MASKKTTLPKSRVKPSTAKKTKAKKKATSPAQHASRAKKQGTQYPIVGEENGTPIYAEDALFDESGEPLYTEDGTFIDDLEPDDVK